MVLTWSQGDATEITDVDSDALLSLGMSDNALLTLPIGKIIFWSS